MCPDKGEEMGTTGVGGMTGPPVLAVTSSQCSLGQGNCCDHVASFCWQLYSSFSLWYARSVLYLQVVYRVSEISVIRKLGKIWTSKEILLTSRCCTKQYKIVGPWFILPFTLICDLLQPQDSSLLRDESTSFPYQHPSPYRSCWYLCVVRITE